MKVKYRFFKNFSTKEVSELKNIDIAVNLGPDAFYFYENNEKDLELRSIFGVNYQDYITVDKTEFTEKERSNSSYLGIRSKKILGYPQPEEIDYASYPFNIFPYLQGTFKISYINENYGVIRGEQIGNISLLKEPKWGNNDIGAIFWLEDLFFTTPKVYDLIFKPLNIKCRKVENYNDKIPLTTIVQLLPQGISCSKLNINDNNIDEKEYVSEWNIVRYHLNNKGFFPSFEGSPGEFDFFITQENFGSGHANYKEIIISQKLYQILKENNIKGLEYSPMMK